LRPLTFVPPEPAIVAHSSAFTFCVWFVCASCLPNYGREHVPFHGFMVSTLRTFVGYNENPLRLTCFVAPPLFPSVFADVGSVSSTHFPGKLVHAWRISFLIGGPFQNQASFLSVEPYVAHIPRVRLVLSRDGADIPLFFRHGVARRSSLLLTFLIFVASHLF